MSFASQMIQTNPNKTTMDAAALARCIQACYDCAQACTACADACLGEGDTQMLTQCIRLDLDCADICIATGSVMSRQTAFDRTMAKAVLTACAQSCKLCGDECEKHAAHHAHCRICTEACRRCEQACNHLLAA